jgi:hypothetical protein
MDRALLQALSDKWDIVMMAPQAFFAALAVGAFGGWLLARIIYNNRLTHHQELIANYRDVLDEKIPARALRPFPAHRSGKMSFGLGLIVFGLAVAASGAIVLLLDKSSRSGPTNQVAAPNLPPITQPTNAPEPLSSRVWSDRTTDDLFALYNGRTMLQADPLIAPYKGKWIEAEGDILQLIPDQINGSIGVLRDKEHLISCAIGPEWNEKLLKLNTGDRLRVSGKIGPSQNGQMLYLMQCELR